MLNYITYYRSVDGEDIMTPIRVIYPDGSYVDFDRERRHIDLSNSKNYIGTRVVMINIGEKTGQVRNIRTGVVLGYNSHNDGTGTMEIELLDDYRKR